MPPARRGQAHPQSARGLGVPGGHERGASSWWTRTKRIRVLMAPEALHDPVDAVTGETEDRVDPPVDEPSDHGLGRDSLHLRSPCRAGDCHSPQLSSTPLAERVLPTNRRFMRVHPCRARWRSRFRVQRRRVGPESVGGTTSGGARGAADALGSSPAQCARPTGLCPAGRRMSRCPDRSPRRLRVDVLSLLVRPSDIRIAHRIRRPLHDPATWPMGLGGILRRRFAHLDESLGDRRRRVRVPRGTRLSGCCGSSNPAPEGFGPSTAMEPCSPPSTPRSTTGAEARGHGARATGAGSRTAPR